MKLRELPKYLWSKYHYSTLAVATIASSCLIAIICTAFGSGLLIPGILIGYVISLGVIGAISQYRARKRAQTPMARGPAHPLNETNPSPPMVVSNHNEVKRLSDEAMAELTKISGPGFTVLTLAARKGHHDSIRDIIQGVVLEQKMILLSQSPIGGKLSPLMAAARFGYNNIVQEILSQLPLEQKMILLTQKNLLGDTPLVFAAKAGDAQIIDTILNSVPLEYKSALLTYRHFGQIVNVAEVAYENGHGDIVVLLQQHGAQLPPQLPRENRLATTFNDRQSTHTATVHDSLARSAIACVARLKTLTEEERRILSIWAKGKLSNQDEKPNHNAVLAIMEKTHIQEQLNALVSQYYPDILQWANDLESTHPRKAIVLRAIQRINNFTTPDAAHTYHEARTHLTLVQLLVLTWMGIKAERGDVNNSQVFFSGKELSNREDRLIQYLWEIQRQYNLNDEGEDFNPQAEDHPACPGGTFNNIIMALSGGVDPDVKFTFVNKDTVMLKATSLLIQLFNPEDTEYTPAIIESLNKNFLDEDDNVPSYSFSEEAKAILLPKLTGLIHKEYNEYILSKTLNESDIQRGIQTMLSVPKKDVVQAITKKLRDFKEKQNVHKTPRRN